MRRVIGLGVGCDSVRAILVSGGRIERHEERPITDASDLSTAVGELLTTLCGSRRSQIRVNAAIGPSSVQVKQLRGLPGATAPAVLSEAVRSNAGRFFLAGSGPVVIPDVEPHADGWWGAAYVESPLRAVFAAARSAGVKVTGCVPTALVLGAAFTGQSVAWCDGDTAILTGLQGREVVSVRRIRCVAATDAILDPALVALGPHAERFADAYGAAVLARPVLQVRPHDAEAALRLRLRVRRSLWGAVMLSAALLTFAPGLTATRARLRAESELAGLQTRAAAAARSGHSFARTLDDLGRVSSYDATRRSMTITMGQIASALPDSTAVVTIRIDTTGVDLVALSLPGAPILTDISRLPGVEGAQFVGALTRELVAGQEFQRTALRFRLRPVASPGVPRTVASR
jgi:hypothetical protein